MHLPGAGLPYPLINWTVRDELALALRQHQIADLQPMECKLEVEGNGHAISAT